VFYLRYIAAELRRRKARTILTSLGLAVGVGLVATVVALSQGLDEAQSKVLAPLTGVGTDMSVDRPIIVSGAGSEKKVQLGFGGEALTGKERRQLLRENANIHAELPQPGELAPGERFSSKVFTSTDLSFPETEAREVAEISGVERIAPALNVGLLTVSGAAPEPSALAGSSSQTGMSISQLTITGVDPSAPDLAPVTPAQVGRGRFFASGARNASAAIVSEGYANRERLAVGDRVKLDKRRFTIVGIARPPLGGQTSDVYLDLGAAQALSGRQRRVNALRVRAASTEQVASVAAEIETSFPGAQVTTASELADRVSGSLVDTKNLSDKLGAALAVVALAAAVLIASLLTLSSVNKRTRELGTLKAVGWRRLLVIRQIIGESLAQGALGGAMGVLIGIGGAALISAFGPTLKATVAQQDPAASGLISSFGQGKVVSGSNSVTLEAPVDISMLLLAIALAVLGGLIAGAIGAGRAARLSPAEALRSVE
jgi:ABC-type antimicrobial peptide transport system permease subunit